MSKASCHDQLDKDTLRSTRSCITFNIRQTERALTRLFDNRLEHIGITSNQFTTLSMLGMMSGQTLKQIADRMGVDISSMSRNIATMKKNGWISTKPNPVDARQKLLFLEPAGCELVEKALPIWQEINGKLQQALGKPLRELLGSLSQLSEVSNEALEN